MDMVGGESVDPPKENLVSVVGGKRVVDCDETENLIVKKKKKKKKNARIDYSEDMKRVAEIVLHLSAMGKLRGWRNPTDAEKELMVEAKDKLVEICQFISPQDVIPKDAIRVVTEDLGLNNSTDQRSGFQPPKMSIAEKFVLAKGKMEESKNFAAQSGTNSSPMTQAGYGTKADVNRITLHTVHKSPALGGFQAASSSVVHVPSLASPASLNQLDVSRVQSASVSRGSIDTSSGSDSSSSHLPQKEGSPFRSVYQPRVRVQSASVSRASIGTSSGLHTVHQSAAVKPSPAHSVGGFQTAPSVVHVSSLASPVSLNQLHVNAVQSASVSRELIGTGSSSLHLFRKEGALFRSGGRPNESIYPSHVQANASGNHATLSPQSLGITKVCQGNRAPNNTCNVDGTTEVTYKVAVQVITDQNAKPSVKTVHENVSMHQPSQVTNYQQPSSVFSNHSDIGKNVQKILHDMTVRLTKRKLAQRQRRERERAERETVKVVESVDEDRRQLAQRQRRARERAEKEMRKVIGTTTATTSTM